MKLTLEGAALQQAVATVFKMSPPIEGVVSLICRDSKFLLSALGEVSRCEILIPAKVQSKDVEFAVPLEALRDAIKGRSNLSMSWDGTMLVITDSSGYKIELLTVEALARDTLDKVEFSEVPLSGEQSVWLKNAVSAVSLKPTIMFASFMPVTVKLTAKGVFVGCYDDQHMAFVNSAEVKGDVTFTLPLDKLQLILDVFAGASFKLRISNSRVELRNKLIFVALNLPSMEDSINADDVIGKAREASKAEGASVSVKTAEVIAFLENSRAVAGKERVEITAATEKDGLRLSIATVRGKANAKLVAKTKSKVSFRIDLDYFDELVRKTRNEELQLTIVESAFVSSKYEAGTILVALNQ